MIEIMRLIRDEFLKAVKFLKPAILTQDLSLTDIDPKTFLHVKISGDES